MAEKTIIINEKKYHLFDDYGTRETAFEVAKEYKKSHKCKYFILEAEEGGLIKARKFLLYLSKKIKIW